MAESRFANALRERGFKEIGDSVPPAVSEEQPRTFYLGQDMRAPITLAVDDIHQSWVKHGIEDLSDMGFKKRELEKPLFIGHDLTLLKDSSIN